MNVKVSISPQDLRKRLAEQDQLGEFKARDIFSLAPEEAQDMSEFSDWHRFNDWNKDGGFGQWSNWGQWQS